MSLKRLYETNRELNMSLGLIPVLSFVPVLHQETTHLFIPFWNKSNWMLKIICNNFNKDF